MNIAGGVIQAQAGPQTLFLSSRADIAIYGGASGGGKTFGLLLEPLRHIHNPRFGAVIFRRTTTQIKVEGGLWDVSSEIYPLVGGRGLSHTLVWNFPSGAKIRMAHLELEKNRFDWQGAQIPLLCFDELTHFTEKQFWYVLSRNRSSSGVSGYVRATCNPDPDSWVRALIAWWIDPETGLAIQGRAGVMRWFVRDGDELHWAAEPGELLERFGAGAEPKSLTFIPASVHDNKILLASDPGYLSNLKSLPLVEREQLLRGNWNIRPAAGSYFRRHYFGVVDAAPAEVASRVRYWDRAATPLTPRADPDATAGVLLSRGRDGIYYVEDVRRMYATPRGVEMAMLRCAQQDGLDTIIGYMQDPGSAGVSEAQAAAAVLDGYNVRFSVATGDKETRAKPVSAQAEAGNIMLVRGAWNDAFLAELESFPNGRHDDQVDALAGAHEMIARGRTVLLA